jgi:hypothetical protein
LCFKRPIVDLTKEEVGTASVRKHLVIIVRHISQRKDVKLRFTAPTSDVNWQKYRESDAAAHQTSDDRHLQETQEQVSIQRVMVEDIAIRNAKEVAEPTKEPIW